jgi:hypothetical protein
MQYCVGVIVVNVVVGIPDTWLVSAGIPSIQAVVCAIFENELAQACESL